jgi:hypothetical protein
MCKYYYIYLPALTVIPLRSHLNAFVPKKGRILHDVLIIADPSHKMTKKQVMGCAKRYQISGFQFKGLMPLKGHDMVRREGFRCPARGAMGVLF